MRPRSLPPLFTHKSRLGKLIVAGIWALPLTALLPFASAQTTLYWDRNSTTAGPGRDTWIEPRSPLSCTEEAARGQDMERRFFTRRRRPMQASCPARRRLRNRNRSNSVITRRYKP